jgi:PleD family two-component response regulator
MLKNSTKPLTLIGRIDSKLFAIYSFNSSSSEMLIWADQLRSNVATYDFPLESALKNQTISVGIASNINYVEFEQVYKIAELALEKAYTEGGNKVVRAN